MESRIGGVRKLGSNALETIDVATNGTINGDYIKDYSAKILDVSKKLLYRAASHSCL
jgi:hypothetical protein